MKKCKSCNKTFVGEETVCPYCGSYPLEEIETPEDTVLSFCPYCGKKIENKNAVFCPDNTGNTWYGSVC
ncbi:MAG: hypothetical protein LUG21_07145 [Clostridiales bacterium]|nr:hypothetical protein [Clostridiales bacterium]